jgi:hypothetical protein
MTEKEKLALIYRVTTGYTYLDGYIIDTPSDNIINESFNIYFKTIENNRFEDFVHKDEVVPILIRNNLWSFSLNAERGSDEELGELEKSLDECKLELYENYGALEKEIIKIRRRLTLIKTRRIKLLNIKHMLDSYTVEGYADYITDLFIFSKIVLNEERKSVQLANSKLDNLINQYKRIAPTNEDLRMLARSDAWRSFWDINNSTFRVNGDNQKTLTLFTKMYNNIYEHPERPPDSIIEDDDMLDGWFLYMKKKANAERKGNTKTKYENKHRNAQEIFIANNEPGSAISSLTPKDIDEIDKMNDTRGRVIKSQIMEGIKHKDIKDMDIPAIRTETLNKARSTNGR